MSDNMPEIVKLKIADLTLHEACQHVPEMRQEEWEPFLADVLGRDVQEPITVQKGGKVLDGRHRMRAKGIRGDDWIYAIVVDLGEKEQIDTVLKAAYLRRQLNESQRGMIAARLWPQYKEAAKQRQREHGETAPGKNKTLVQDSAPVTGKSRERVAQAIGVSHFTVERAADVLRHGTPSLIAAVDSGKVRVNQASQIAHLPAEEQDKWVAAGVYRKPQGPKKQRVNGDVKWSLSGSKLSNATYSERLRAAGRDVSGGRHRHDACLHYGLSDREYQRGRTVIDRATPALIEALDSGLLTLSACYDLASGPAEGIAKAIEGARLKEAEKRRPPRDPSVLPVQQQIINLLEETWASFRGFAQNVKVNSKAIPQDPAKYAEMLRLVRNVRDAVNPYLDLIEREARRCLPKTAEQKDS